MRRVPREVWWIAVLTLVAGSIAWMLSSGRPESGEQIPNMTTYSSSKSGLRALYLTLDRLHYRVGRLGTPLTEGLPGQGVLVIAQPIVPITDSELTALTQWVKQGHTLFLIADSGLAGLLRANPAAAASMDLPTTTARPSQPTYLAQGVSRLAVRLDENVEISSGDTVIRPPAHPVKSFRKKGARKAPEPWSELTQGVTLFRDDNHPAVTYQKLGKGRMVFLLSSWSISNDGIDQADNLNLVLNVLGPPGPARPISFDEYHHGYGRARVLNLLSSPRQRLLARLTAVQLGFALLLVMYARSRRLGRVVPLQREVRQRSEFLGTMTAILRKGEASTIAVRTARDALAARLTRQLGLPPDADSAALVQAAARVNAEAAEKLEAALRVCDTAVRARKFPQSAALSVLRSLDEAERLLRQI